MLGKIERFSYGRDRMKQIFRNLKNNNKNKAITHKIYVENQCGKKPRTATSTINPLYEQGHYKAIAITTSDLIQ